MLKVAGGTLWAVALAAGITACAAGEDFPKDTRVALVDVSMVFKSYKRVYEVQRQVDSQFEERRKALGKEGRELADEEQKIDDLRQRPGGGESEQTFDRVQRFQKQLYQYRKKKDQLELAIVQRMREEMKLVLNEIRAAVRKEAEKGSFNLVLRAADRDDPTENPGAKPVADIAPEDFEKLDPKKQQEVEIKKILTPRSILDLLIRSRRNPVLYGDWKIDITETVLKRLNEDYEKTLKQP